MHKFKTSAIKPKSATETGAGVIGTAFGASAFLAFLLMATHTLLSLYAGSVLSERAWSAGQELARSDNAGSASIESVTASTRASLSGFKNVDVEISKDQAHVFVQIEADRPTFLPKALNRNTGLTRLSKTASVRSEGWQ